MAIGPVLVVETGEGMPRVRGPGRRGPPPPRPSSHGAANAAQSFLARGVDEHMESVTPPLKDALAGPPDNDAVSHGRGLLDEALRQRGHRVRIEHIEAWPRRTPRKPPPCQNALARRSNHGSGRSSYCSATAGFHAGGLGDLLDQATVQQLPAETVGEQFERCLPPPLPYSLANVTTRNMVPPTS